MNYLKYFQNQEYELGSNDCWTFTQQIFKDEENKILPDLPVVDENAEGYLRQNLKLKRVEKAHKGCVIFVKTKGLNHTGYALNENEYLHKTLQMPQISRIPKTAEIYEIL